MHTIRSNANKNWFIIALFALLSLVLWHHALIQEQPETLKVVFLDVGQGDSIFMQTPSGKTMLVDGGGMRKESSQDDPIGGRVVVPFLRSEGVNKIDLLVISHPHDDHIRGLVPVVRNFEVGAVLDPGIPHALYAYGQLLGFIEEKDIEYKKAVRGQIIDFGDGVRAEILHPPPQHLKGTGDDINNNSVVMRIIYDETAILLTGDAGFPAEAKILSSGAEVQSDYLKVGHHGSRFSTGDDWLDAVNPEAAIICVGINSFGHPTNEVLRRLDEKGVQVYRTDEDGAVILEIGRGNRGIYGYSSKMR